MKTHWFVLCLAIGCGRSKAGSAATPPSVSYDAHVSAGGIAPQGGRLQNPFNEDKQSAADGGLLFSAMNCDGCHGTAAAGAEGPNLGDGRWRYGGSDGAVFQSIYYGRPRGMPAYGGVLPPAGVWKLVSYLRSLSVPDDVPTESWR